jgi:hypothetical protein
MMKQKPMKPETHLYTKRLGFVLLLLSTLLFTACGAKIIRGAAPLVRMTELSHQDNTIELQLSMRNLNGVALEVLAIDVNLAIDGNEIVVFRGPVDTSIAANGTETWSVEVEESQSSQQLLDQIQNGDVKSLPYALKGSITSKEEGNLRFEYEGHIYPLPGKPGHFR